jgi:hypothetical protein
LVASRLGNWKFDGKFNEVFSKLDTLGIYLIFKGSCLVGAWKQLVPVKSILKPSRKNFLRICGLWIKFK